MGPIEKELRAKADIIPSNWPTFERMSNGAKQVCWDAGKNLNIPVNYFSTRANLIQVMSDAIEAAERLGL